MTDTNTTPNPDPWAGLDDSSINIEKIAPSAGAKVKVAGIAGWYGEGTAPERGSKAIGASVEGDTFATTSADGHAVAGVDRSKLKDNPGIMATPFESAGPRARRMFGGRLDDETKLVLATRADGGAFDVPRYFVVWKSDDKALGMVGKVAAQQDGKGPLPTVVDPAPLLLQPKALDIVDGLSGVPLWQGIDRGGCIGGTTPWLQARPIKVRLPDLPGESPGKRNLRERETLNIRPMVSNPLDGTGCLFLALTLMAVSCRNVYASIMGSRRGIVKVRHCKSGEAMLRKLRKALELVAESMPERLSVMFKMTSATIDDEWLEREFLPRVLNFEPGTSRADMSGKVRNRFDSVMEYYRSAPGAEPGTVWGALQAVTYLGNHHYNGKAGETYQATPAQIYKGGAGALEERALDFTRQAFLSSAERKVFATLSV